MTTDSHPVSLIVQRATREDVTPSDDELLAWAAKALTVAEPQSGRSSFELSVRLVDEAEGREMNARYRGKETATNVLSFPAELPAAVSKEMAERSGIRIMGDLLICAPVVNREAHEQDKTTTQHWAHLLVHGVLHLLGHDHLEKEQAEAMETLEITILGSLGIADPYRES